MAIIPNGGGGMKRNRRFYLILILAIGLIGTSIMMVSGGIRKDSHKDKDEASEDFVIVEDEEPSLEISKMDEEISIDDYFREREMEARLNEEGEEVGEEVEDLEDMEEDLEEDLDDDLDYTLVEGENLASTTMITPVDGDLGLKYTTGNLVYSKTLDEWTNHNGIDILAPKGTKVRAALNGTITEVYKDQLWGTVIIIDHGDGLLTKYASLSQDVQVVEGSYVNQGDIIGEVDETASIEMMEGAHLHFEVIYEGINKNPIDFLP